MLKNRGTLKMSLVIFGEDEWLGVVRGYDKREKKYSVYHYNSTYETHIRKVTEVEYELVPGGIIYNSGYSLVFVEFETFICLNVPKDIRQHWLEQRREATIDEV